MLVCLSVAVTLFAAGCVAPWGDEDLSTKDLQRDAIAHDGLGDISYLMSGSPDDPRVIYVHGTPGSAAAYAPFIREPIEGLESIAIDRPGFGRSARRAEPSFEAQARAIEPFLVRRNGRWPILVGHSLGGPIIARVAAEHPERVAGLVIVAGSLDPELEEWRWFNSLASAFRFALPRAVKNSNEEIRDAKAETTALADVLHRVRCPVIILHGDRDKLVPVENVEYMRDAFANAASIDVTILDGEGHFILWSHKEVVRGAVEALSVR